MSRNVILFGWNRAIPGREKMSAPHFEEFVKYLDGLKEKGSIRSFDVVFLDPHGGDLNGFFLIRGETQKLDALLADSAWVMHITRATLHLDGSGVIGGVTGDEVNARMALWSGAIPS